jgi:hypothetical protein
MEYINTFRVSQGEKEGASSLLYTSVFLTKLRYVALLSAFGDFFYNERHVRPNPITIPQSL